MNRIVRLFNGADMRAQHSGLKALARAKGVNLDQLDFGEHVVFLNAAKSRMKIFSCNGVLSYFYKDKGEIDMGIIQEIPKTFDSTSGFDFRKATQERVLKKMKLTPKKQDKSLATMSRS